MWDQFGAERMANAAGAPREGSRWLTARKTCYDFASSCYATPGKQRKETRAAYSGASLSPAHHRPPSANVRLSDGALQRNGFLTRRLTAPDIAPALVIATMSGTTYTGIREVR